MSSSASVDEVSRLATAVTEQKAELLAVKEELDAVRTELATLRREGVDADPDFDIF